MQRRAIVMLFAALLASTLAVEAGAWSPARKLLQYGRYGRYDSASAQLAANQAAATRTSYAINAAVESGANPYVTQGATWYGADQAYWAANSRRYCGYGWYGYGCGKK